MQTLIVLLYIIKYFIVFVWRYYFSKIKEKKKRKEKEKYRDKISLVIASKFKGLTLYVK